MTVQCAKCGQHLTTEQLAPGPQGVRCAYCGATVPVFEQNTLVTSRQSTPVPTDLEIQGYEILSRLGEGGMGIVYRARQVSLDRKVAIKVLSPTLLQDPSFLARFDREIAALVRLSHPHIVTIFDRGQTATGQVYYVMEYVEGEASAAPLDLERMIAEGRLDSQRTRELMVQVVQALGFAHREGIIHRDVKPTNILIDRHGFAKVADFGIACMRGDHPIGRVTTANAAVGTAIYASPEQQQDAASVDHRSDIYGAGVMLYQMLTGNLPLAGYAPPSLAVPGLSRQWDAIVAKAIQPRPEDRFGDMAEFETGLRSLGPTVVAQPMPAPAPTAFRPPSTAGGSVPLVCPQCGGSASDADLFCVTCGVSLWNDCRQCGQRAFAAARFCPGCRSDLENQRGFEEYLQLAKDYLDQARHAPPSTDCVRQLEQARLGLGKALELVDDAGARSLADEANRLTVSVAWQAGEAAAEAKRLSEASYCYGQILEASPDHRVAAACLQKIRAYRSELIEKAQRLFADGRRSNALALLRTGVEQFEDDAELADLYAQYHENSAQLKELKDRIPALAEQNRWCELTQLLAELRLSGIPMKRLDEWASKAQQRLAAVEPLISAAKRSLDDGNTAQAVAQANEALKHVADHAEAVEIIELAQSRDRLAQAGVASRRRRRRVVVSIAALACLALLGSLVYVYRTEARAVDQAEQQIGGGDYDAGVETLSTLPHRYFHGSRVRYLENVARLKQYACGRETPDETLLQSSKAGLLNLIGANDRWLTRAKADLADTIDRVPADVPDTLTRSLAIAQVLKELQVADPAALAAGLVAKAQQRSPAGSPALAATDTAYVLQILEWDPTAAEKVVELALPQGPPLASGLAAVRAWAAAGTSFTTALSAAVVRIADREAERGAFQDAGLAIDAATRMDVDCDATKFWDKHFQQKVTRGDARGAVELLSYMLQGQQDSTKLGHAVKLYQSLKGKLPQSAPPPPPQISVEVSRDEFDKLVGEAEQAMKQRECLKALSVLDAGRQQYPDLYQSHAKARAMYAEAAFTDTLRRAQEFLAAGDLDTAAEAVDEALQMRRDDPSAPMLRQQVRAGLGQQLAKEGRRLLDAEAWDKAVEHLQSALQRLPDDTQLLALSDEANAQRHHTAARRAIDRGDYRAAVDEIIGVRVVLEGRSNVAWTVPLRPAVDALAVAVRDAVCGQAQKLADQRQYQEALENLQLASRLSSADAKVANLRDQIAALSAGAKTADLTGTWRAPPGLLTPNGMQLAPEITDFEFTDRGSEITVTAVQLPRQIREFTGQWRRNGTRLEGNFHFVLWDQTSVSAAVTANIKKDSKTLAVEWKQIRYTDLKKKEFKLEGYVDWTRVE